MTFIKQQSKVRGQASADLEQLIQSKEISDYCESPHFEAMDITALLASSGLHSKCVVHALRYASVFARSNTWVLGY